MSSFTTPKILPTIVTPTPRKLLSASERKAKQLRREAWNGKQKYGSYTEHQLAMQMRAEQREAMAAAEAAGEFVPVKRKGKSKKKQELSAAISASKGQFAAFGGELDEDEEPPVLERTSTKRTWAQVTVSENTTVSMSINAKTKVAETMVAETMVATAGAVSRVLFLPIPTTKVEPALPWGGTTGIVRGQKDGWYESDDEED